MLSPHDHYPKFQEGVWIWEKKYTLSDVCTIPPKCWAAQARLRFSHTSWVQRKQKKIVEEKRSRVEHNADAHTL